MPTNADSHRGNGRNFKSGALDSTTTPTKQADCSTVMDPVQLHQLVCALLEQGHALAIARTRDGGAVCLTFFVDNSRSKRYIASRAEWDALIGELLD